MDDRRFDAMTRSLAGGATRRQLLRGLLGVGSGLMAVSRLEAEAARRPTPTPKPVKCPTGQSWDGSQCACISGSTCGSDCCQAGSVCCDNACCYGECHAEEICCAPGDYYCDGACTICPCGQYPLDGVCYTTCSESDEECCGGWCHPGYPQLCVSRVVLPETPCAIDGCPAGYQCDPSVNHCLQPDICPT